MQSTTVSSPFPCSSTMQVSKSISKLLGSAFQFLHQGFFVNDGQPEEQPWAQPVSQRTHLTSVWLHRDSEWTPWGKLKDQLSSHVGWYLGHMASQLLWWEISDRSGAILVVLHLPQTESLISWVALEQSPENRDLWGEQGTVGGDASLLCDGET